MYLSKKINRLNSLYVTLSLLTISILGLFLSVPLPLSIKIGFPLLLLFILCFFVKPELSILLLILIRPLIDPFTNIRFTEYINLLGVFSVLFIVFLIFLFFKYRKFELAPSNIRFYYIFLFVSLLSVINSVNVTESIMYFIRFVSLLAIYLLIYNIVQRENDALRVIKCVIYSSIIPIIFGFYQYTAESGMIVQGFDRLNSTFVHPNMYAFYLVIIFFSIMYLYYLEKNMNGKSDLIFKILLSVLVLIQLMHTYTRGAWIGIMVGLFIVAFFIKKARKWIFISSIVFIVVFSPQIINRMIDLINPPTKNYMSTWDFRLEHWNALLKGAFIHKPLLGYGLGQSIFAAKKYSHFLQVAHNDYLRVLIEIGIIGLIPFLLFLTQNLWSLYKKIKNKIYLELNTILLGLFIALLVSSFADNLIYSISVVSYLFVMLAVGHKLNFLNSNNAK